MLTNNVLFCFIVASVTNQYPQHNLLELEQKFQELLVPTWDSKLFPPHYLGGIVIILGLTRLSNSQTVSKS